MSARLTKSDREQMAKALVRHKFHDQAEALMQESVELFDAVYGERYDEPTQKLMRQLTKRHPTALSTDGSAYVNARGMSIYVGASHIGVRGVVDWLPAVAPRPVFYSGHSGEVSVALGDRTFDFALRLKTFNEGIRPAYHKALATLNQFHTGKKLADEWPEAMPVIGNLIPASERNLPVVQLTAINDEFGLPPSETEAA